MIKILTAIGNPNLNDNLKKDDDFEIIENDIFYREGVIEYLEKNDDVDILILYEKLSGEINIINLIKNIKNINDKINIFFILENKNEELEKLLKIENIKNIFYNDKMNLKEFIERLKHKDLHNDSELQKEIDLLKNIISKKDEELLKYKNSYLNDTQIKKDKKSIIIVGPEKVGKTLIINNLKNVSENNNEFEFKELNIDDFLIEENIFKISYKIIFVFELNFEKMKLNKKIIKKVITEYNVNSKKINIIFNKTDKYSINKKIGKNIFCDYKIIGNIKLNNYCDFALNKKNNYKKENNKLKKEYLKILNKIIYE